MRKLVAVLFFFSFGIVMAQEKTQMQKDSIAAVQNQMDKDAAVKLVEDFFVAFHKQDTLKLREFAHPDIEMRSIAVDSSGNSTIKSVAYSNFLKSMYAIPTSTIFEERLNAIAVYANGELGNVLTPYTFFINGKLSHCGVNSFQLLKVDKEWKIINIVDTRKNEGCEVEKNK